MPNQLIDCPYCGLRQALVPSDRKRLRCTRCLGLLSAPVRSTGDSLALALSAATLFVVANAWPLLGVSIAGRERSVELASGVPGLARHGYLPLAIFVLVIATLAPLIRLAALGGALAFTFRPRHSETMSTVLRWAERMRVWSMLDVFLVGALIALSKLHDLARVEVGTAMWALGLLVIVLIWFESTIDMPALWAAIGPNGRHGLDDREGREAARSKPDVSCEVCRLMQAPADRCLRCQAALHRRKPDSLHRTAALVVTGLILYIPANLYPVFTVVSFGKSTTATIMGGVIELMTGNDWPLAVIVFVASIVVPLMKLLGLATLLVSIRLRSRGHLLARTRLFRVIELIGRWSSVDIFVAALLTALVTLGNLATIVPGLGVLAFGAVVFVTIVATSTFDPRLMWDTAGENGE